MVGSTWKKIVNDPAKDVLVALLSEGLFCVTCDDFVDSVWTRVAEKLEERGSADPSLPSHARMVEPIQTRWTCTYAAHWRTDSTRIPHTDRTTLLALVRNRGPHTLDHGIMRHARLAEHACIRAGS